MHLKTRQRGMSFWGILLMLVVFGFSAIIGLKLIPVYLESYKIDKAMKAVVQAPGVSRQTQRDIIIALSKRLDIDGVRRIDDTNFKEYGLINKQNGKVTMEIYYQAEVPLFGNLRLLAEFDKVVSN
jgi:hypothetical protein